MVLGLGKEWLLMTQIFYEHALKKTFNDSICSILEIYLRREENSVLHDNQMYSTFQSAPHSTIVEYKFLYKVLVYILVYC